MCPGALQQSLFAPPAVQAGTAVVNDRVSVLTSGGHRVVCVDGLIVHHYLVGDRLAETYAMVMLIESGYAPQNDIAKTFGCAARTIGRARERFQAGGLQALGRAAGRPCGSRALTKRDRLRDQTIWRMKSQGASHRAIARRLGLSETAIRKRLARLNWKPGVVQLALFEADPPTAPTAPGDPGFEVPRA